MARGQFPASRMWPNDRKKAFFENVSADICGHISDSPFAPSPNPLTVSRRVPPSSPFPFHPPWTLNIWTFEHLNIWTLEHLDMLISAAFNILYACTFLSALTFLSVLPYPQSSGRMCRGDFYLFSFESVNADICGHISICVHISAQNVNADIWRGIS